MVLGSGFIKKETLRKRCSESDFQNFGTRPPRRHETFADIEELYKRYGGSSLSDSGK